MTEINVNMAGCTKTEVTKVLKILDTKFNGYHAPSLLHFHTREYGVLKIYYKKHAVSTMSRPSNAIPLKEFFRKYGRKSISFKGIL